MNIKRFLLACLGVYIAIQVTNPVVHGVFLGKEYEALSHVWRADMTSKMWVMFITDAVFALLFIYIYSKGREGRGIGEGIRFGIIVGLLMNGVGLLNQYVVYPVPFSLVIKWFILAMIQFVIYGLLACLIYKPKEA